MKCYSIGNKSIEKQKYFRFTSRSAFFLCLFFTIIFPSSYMLLHSKSNFQQEYYQQIIKSADLKTIRDFLYFINLPLEQKDNISSFEKNFLTALVPDKSLQEQILTDKHTRAVKLHHFVVSDELKPETYSISFKNQNLNFISQEKQFISVDYLLEAVNADGIILSTEIKNVELELQRQFSEQSYDQKDANPTGLKILSYKETD